MSHSLAASSLRAVIKQVTARHAAATLIPTSFAVARRLQSSACCRVSHDIYHDPYNAIQRGPNRVQRIRMHEEEISRIKREARERMERDLVELRSVRRSLENEGVRIESGEVDGRVGPVIAALRELREVKGGSLMGEKVPSSIAMKAKTFHNGKVAQESEDKQINKDSSEGSNPIPKQDPSKDKSAKAKRDDEAMPPVVAFVFLILFGTFACLLGYAWLCLLEAMYTEFFMWVRKCWWKLSTPLEEQKGQILKVFEKVEPDMFQYVGRRAMDMGMPKGLDWMLKQLDRGGQYDYYQGRIYNYTLTGQKERSYFFGPPPSGGHPLFR